MSKPYKDEDDLLLLIKEKYNVKEDKTKSIFSSEIEKDSFLYFIRKLEILFGSLAFCLGIVVLWIIQFYPLMVVVGVFFPFWVILRIITIRER
ncbi:MAG: hypothetical protein ACTSUV_02360 [Candidatus Ranarchaeia archaeon]